MLELKTKQKLAGEAFNLAGGKQLVRYHNTTYIPADYETLDVSVPPDLDRTIWLPMTRSNIRTLAADMFSTLFANDSELSSFDFMVAQTAKQIETAASSLLVRGPSGLQELNDEGKLVEATGEFRPNAVQPMLNVDQKEKDRVFAVISGWLDSDEEAESLLSHLATCLAPGWSAVKYVILLGEGRNGKSLMLKMLHSLFGTENVSNVPRQEISEGTPMVIQLNNKLLNLIFDGQATYLKDSGREKSLIAGETVSIKELYRSEPVQVQTNALFIEGLQHEPKTKDKSSALQKRLVRFGFPNVYPLDHKFERAMLTEASLGAFLSLLIDRYVREDEVATRLAPTTKAIELQLEHLFSNSVGLQYLKYVEEHDPLGTAGLIGKQLHDMVSAFQSWRLKENDIGQWAEPDVLALFAPLVNTERKTQRVNGQPRKVRLVTSLKYEANAFIESLKGADDDAALIEALVDDGSL